MSVSLDDVKQPGPAARLRVLMWRWCPDPREEIAPTDAQACEYADVMGPEALQRQWQGSERALKRVKKILSRGRAA